MNKYLLMHQHYCIINDCTHGIWYYIIRMQSDEDVSDQRKLSVTHSKTQWAQLLPSFLCSSVAF